MFRSAIDAGTGWGIALAVIAAVNSVIAFYYYFRVVVQMWLRDPATEDRSRVGIPAALGLAMVLTSAFVVVVGIYPQVVARIGEMAF
jgi:NADH-quinone oxidoreductase subunit N